VKKKGMENWEALMPELFQVHGGSVDLETVTADAPEAVRYLVRAHCDGPFELYAEGHGVAIKERGKELAAQQVEVAAKCMEILTEHQEDVAAWLWSLIR
jgi:hypothetical protein